MSNSTEMSLLNLDVQEFMLQLKNYVESPKVIPDNIIRLISEDIDLTKESIISLNDFVFQKIRAYEVTEPNLSTDIKFIDGRILHLSNIDMLLEEDFSKYTSCVENIVLTWRMKIKFKYIDLPQEQVLVVKFSNGIKPQEMFQILISGKIEDASNLETQFHPVVIQCFFTDRQFGGELISLVEKWVDTVKRKSNFMNNRFIKFFKQHPILIAETIRIGTLSFIICSTLILTYNEIDRSIVGKLSDRVDFTKDAILHILFVLLLMVISLMLVNSIAKFFSRNVYKLIDDYGKSFIFNITKDDKDRNNEIQKQNRYIIIKFVCTTILNVIVNMSYIFLDHFIF